MSSLCASMATGSLLISLIFDSDRRPGFSCTCAWNEHRAVTLTRSCCASALNRKLWNKRAALGFGALWKTALGAVIDGALRSRRSLQPAHPLLQQQQIGLGTVGLYRALAQRELLWRIGRRQHLGDSAVRRASRKRPAEVRACSNVAVKMVSP